MNPILKKIYATLAFLSFIFLIGTVGSLECDKLSFTESLVQSSILMFCLYFFAKLAGAFDYTEYVGDTEQSENIEIDQLELFRQINIHKSINGYRLFSKIQDGNYYNVTFLSQDNKSCVLAEVEDINNPHGEIKIIAF